MRQIFFLLVVALALSACGNDTGPSLEDPSSTHPPSEAIPDSMKITQDSTIVPDTAPGGNMHMGNGDTAHQHP